MARQAMTRQARERFVATLAMLLTLAAGGAFVGGYSGGLLVPIAAVLVMAYAKGRFVVLDFMELREAPGPLRQALLAWPAMLLALALVRSITVSVLG
nr:cytochrome C oxidase subunit IV family protein [Shinella pollutisoli]